jgi:integrase/recombinase XerD
LYWTREFFVQVARDWLAFLGRLERTACEPAPFAPLLSDFARFMQCERGLSPKTINNYIWFAQRFLGCLDEQGRPFAEVSILDVDAFIRQCEGNWGRVSMANCAKALRAFFRHAQRHDWCAAGIAEAIESPRVFKQESLPAGPDWCDVQRLISSADTDRPHDIRDRPILMLLSIYGLRSAEVAHLVLDNLDWEHERLRVFRSKQRRTQEYPLTRAVGDAILRYLKEVRPHSSRREVFLRLRAPLNPLSPGGMHNVVSARMAQLNIASMRQGPHALRHACAAHLVTEGFSLKEIGDHLGHRSAYATRIYAKVDLEGLREVARLDLGDIL